MVSLDNNNNYRCLYNVNNGHLAQKQILSRQRLFDIIPISDGNYLTYSHCQPEVNHINYFGQYNYKDKNGSINRK